MFGKKRGQGAGKGSDGPEAPRQAGTYPPRAARTGARPDPRAEIRADLARPEPARAQSRRPEPPARGETSKREAGGPTSAAQRRLAELASHRAEAEPLERSPDEPEAAFEGTGELEGTFDSSLGEGRTLTVGQGIRLSGDIKTCDTLIVEGTVEANLTDSLRLEISESGLFKGEAVVAVAEIAGRFEGELTVRERLIVHASGEVAGLVRYAELEVERGGRIGGRIEVLGEEDFVPEMAAAAAVETHQPVAQPDQAELLEDDAPPPPRDEELERTVVTASGGLRMVVPEQPRAAKKSGDSKDA